jgi:hypothetical protein
MSHTVAPNSLLVFDGSNYTFWKIRMRAYLKYVDVWYIVESGWNDLDKIIAELSRSDQINSSSNDKALNAIFTSMCAEEFARISRCDS